MPMPHLRRTVAASAATALLFTHLSAPTATPAPRHESGGGWDEIVCAACVGAGTAILLSGASALNLLLANPSLTAGAVQVCVRACRSAIEEATG